MLKECLLLVFMFLLLYDLWMYFHCCANFLNNSLYWFFLVHFSALFLVGMFWHFIYYKECALNPLHSIVSPSLHV